MKRSMTLLGISLVLAMCWSSPTVRAFCGFYVAKADAKLFNRASQVVLVRHDDKTVITMANDFQGDPTEFAVVIPVPTFMSADRSTSRTKRSSITSTLSRRRGSSNISTKIRADATTSWSARCPQRLRCQVKQDAAPARERLA